MYYDNEENEFTPEERSQHAQELARYKRDMRIVNSILAGCAIALVVLLVWF